MLSLTWWETEVITSVRTCWRQPWKKPERVETSLFLFSGHADLGKWSHRCEPQLSHLQNAGTNTAELPGLSCPAHSRYSTILAHVSAYQGFSPTQASFFDLYSDGLCHAPSQNPWASLEASFHVLWTMVFGVRVTWLPIPSLLLTNCVTSTLRESLSSCASGIFEEDQLLQCSQILIEVIFWQHMVSGASQW